MLPGSHARSSAHPRDSGPTKSGWSQTDPSDPNGHNSSSVPRAKGSGTRRKRRTRWRGLCVWHEIASQASGEAKRASRGTTRDGKRGGGGKEKKVKKEIENFPVERRHGQRGQGEGPGQTVRVGPCSTTGWPCPSPSLSFSVCKMGMVIVTPSRDGPGPPTRGRQIREPSPSEGCPARLPAPLRRGVGIRKAWISFPSHSRNCRTSQCQHTWIHAYILIIVMIINKEN